MATLDFHPLALTDCEAVRRQIHSTDCRNCDLNYMNLMSWRFVYQTELAFHQDWLVFRFKVDNAFAYLPPIGLGDWNDILLEVMADARAHNEEFRLMGVCPHSLERLNETMPDRFVWTSDRNYTDYIYLRESLAQLGGKKLQPKRNHINRFERLYPDYEFSPLTDDDFAECLMLAEKWRSEKEDEAVRQGALNEQGSLRFCFENWERLCGRGGVLRVGGKIVAFTYGAGINYDTFDVCMEKADVEYEGAFTMINREFVRSLPENYIYINREEDLGIEGLRRAKLSYQPHFLLHKHTVKLRPEE